MSYFDLYRGATLSKPLTTSLGSTAAGYDVGSALIQRRKLLQAGIAQGKINTQQLGTFDSTLLGLKGSPTNIGSDVGGGGHGVFGFLGNLGSDIVNFGREFVPGLVETGKAAAHDVPFLFTHQFPGNDSEVLKKVIKPTVQGVGQDVGNVIHGRWDKLYQHPLNPILDLTAAASLGVGGAARAGATLSRVGALDDTALGSLARGAANLTARTGRSPVDLGSGVQFEREFSARPLTKLAQRTTDKLVASRLGEVPVVPSYRAGAGRLESLQDVSKVRAQRGFARNEANQAQLDKAAAIRDAIIPLEQQFKDLSPDESTALHLALRGINTPERITAFQDIVHRALRNENPEGFNHRDFGTVDKLHTQYLANLNDEVKHLAIHPNEAMINAAEVWGEDVAKGHDVLGITPEEHAAAVAKPQQNIDEHIAQQYTGLGHEAPEPAPTHEPGQLAPQYAPDISAEGVKYYEPNRVNRVLRGVTGAEPHMAPREERVSTGAVTAQNLLAPKPLRYTQTSTGAMFSAGAFRTDARAFLDHTARREADVVDQAYKRTLVNKMAAKDKEGNELRFKTPDDVRNWAVENGYNAHDWVLAHPEFPMAWYRAERNVLDEALRVGKQLMEKGLHPHDPNFESAMEHLASTDAQAFIRTQWGAMKRQGVAIPSDFYEYQKKLTTVNDPFTNGLMRAYSSFINLWRSYTLSYMPRWALNTAVGTFMQSIVHGTINPRDYLTAHELHTGHTYTESLMGRAGRDIHTAPSELPHGVRLGREALLQEIGPQRTGLLQRATGMQKLDPRKLAEGVQAIEDHFRSGMFVRSLKRAEQERLRAMGETMKSWYEKGLSDTELVRQMMENPDTVRRAMRDVNTFAYNYQHLGPFERKYVRQFVPFWGWYKFISKLVWRLPFEYPGRARVMDMLSNIGEKAQDDLGAVPDWLRGMIILNTHGGNLHYLSGLGINPFSQFANPAAPHGTVNGLLQLGQLSPQIQAALQAFGFDPLTGDTVRISPQEGLSHDFLGRLVDEHGDQIAPSSVNPVERFLASLAREFPQYRIGEKFAPAPLGAGGGSVYPESLPLIHYRPMAPGQPGQLTGLPAVAVTSSGLAPKSYDLAKFQQLRRKSGQYAHTRIEGDLRRLRRKLAGKK